MKTKNKERIKKIGVNQIVDHARQLLPCLVRTSLAEMLGLGAPAELVPVWKRRPIYNSGCTRVIAIDFEVGWARPDTELLAVLHPAWPEIRALAQAYLRWRTSQLFLRTGTNLPEGDLAPDFLSLASTGPLAEPVFERARRTVRKAGLLKESRQIDHPLEWWVSQCRQAASRGETDRIVWLLRQFQHARMPEQLPALAALAEATGHSRTAEAIRAWTGQGGRGLKDKGAQ